MKKVVYLFFLCLGLTSCEDMFNPALENNKNIEGMYTDAKYAQGLLGSAYRLLPYSSSPSSDLATDDAVSNDKSNKWSKMASGGWTANDDQASYWDQGFHAVQYINLFLSIVDDVAWDSDEKVRILFRDRLKGEALGLRALQYYYLLRSHAGLAVNGEFLGVPIKREPENNTTDFNQPRDKFVDCIDFILTDCDEALNLLPVDYKSHQENEIPQRYIDMGITDVSLYDRVNGDHMGGRISGRIVEAIRAQMALMASSPAYKEYSGITSDKAAQYAAEVLERINFELPADGGTWYKNMENVSGGKNPDEIIWRSNNSDSNNMEGDNFPPTLFGKGRINPTQNLVDAFPMKNGYPITDLDNSDYDKVNPYNNRDPRLGKYVVYNGSQVSGNNILTASESGTLDGLNNEIGFSTRTGYYMKKLLVEECNLDPKYDVKKKHYNAYIRYTEIFLAFAEAVNESKGPLDNSYGKSAYEVVKMIRQRAGIEGEDLYLESIKNDPEKMKEMIRNERRLELCFENHRFYDLRRWNVEIEKLNETAKGVDIKGSGSIYEYIDVDKRLYEPYMYYGPIPEKEVLKFNKLYQNKGWDKSK